MSNSADDEADIAAADYNTLDLARLPFDMDGHRHGLAAMARMGMDRESILPALRARDLVFVRVPSGKFRIDIRRAKGAEYNAEEPRTEIIYQSINKAQAEKVHGEVERYFLRHFPGRIVSDQSAKLTADDLRQATGVYGVYITCPLSE